MNLGKKSKKSNGEHILNGIYYFSEPAYMNPFEELYIKMRTIEERIYDDKTVGNLPEIGKNHIHLKEWNVRKNSSGKLLRYLAKKKRELKILDLGCGNGWLSNKLSGLNGSFVIGTDVNQSELEQAARVFWGKPNLVFAYANIFDSNLDEQKFDIIILAGVLMYFSDAGALLDKLLSLLDTGGEIHIIDNALYNDDELQGAKERTREHYMKMGLSEMTKIIYHHLISEFDKYKPEIIYDPNKFSNRLKRKSVESGLSPFYWIKITK